MTHLHLAIALDGAGWHPAAWREPGARPGDLFTAGYWVDLARSAERGLVDLITIEDSFGLQSSDVRGPDGRNGRVRGRLDAVQIAARVAPATRYVGLVPTALVTHTEPFHLAKAIATLDYVSHGRAGVRAQISPRAVDSDLVGRRYIPEFDRTGPITGEAAELLDELFTEAWDYVEVLRRLWDSWEDDAEIRDAVTGRFIDRNRLHAIDFTGDFFSVKGPSITPRPPQGQPLVTALAHAAPDLRELPIRFAAGQADLVWLTPHDRAQAQGLVEAVHLARQQSAAGSAPVHTFADLVVFLDRPGESGADRKERLDTLDGREYRSDAGVFTGSAAELADLLVDWQQAGITGFRLRPGVLPDDLDLIVEALTPELQARGRLRRNHEASTLRGLLGLPRPENRYATTRQGVNA
ncbi:LLM class flavin-dependent oxidoreductase [Nakamurella multipartita]|uniref:Xenobiotic compound monooxygenase, DszA family, A subunit n=1 Tax=Nakamurella multipartita (strain ATCC 700099 / DSM 44233 / CIP 104796 / JCM 9543 / NBRC 105858 / Y-104) TaxID=479431 RepID=C8XJS7_NAKMY|nr:LLM class flavin-dependent oxidoreductase [Nakamurella multipartita]ACV80638.1 xenobiotic compound monooxygenase, DszA family, A subunit [Nakamurella multipartita DSM 44233]